MLRIDAARLENDGKRKQNRGSYPFDVVAGQATVGGDDMKGDFAATRWKQPCDKRRMRGACGEDDNLPFCGKDAERRVA
jgi:hypothetical protein